MADSQPSLFSVKNGDPLVVWSSLARELEAFQPSLLEMWKREYDCWCHHYRRFRDFEQQTFYTATEKGETPQPVDVVVRLHRRSVLALLQSGEQAADHLLALSLTGDEAKERMDCERKLRILLDSLQETLELWHPVNMERIEEKKAIFAR